MRRASWALAALSLAAAGCGSDSDRSSDQAALTSALAHSAFVDRGDRICTEGRKRLIISGNRYFGGLPAGRHPSDAALAAFADREAVPILRRQYGRLRGLRPPPGDHGTIDRILDLADQGIAQLRADPTLLDRGSGIPPALERARHRAFLYGLGACGEAIQRPARGRASGGSGGGG
jgi:hypothetical protein